VLTCSLDGCVPTTVVSAVSSPHALAVTIDEIRYVSGEKAYRVPRSGGSPAVLIDHQFKTTPIVSFAQSNGHIYYANDYLIDCVYSADMRCFGDDTIAVEPNRDVAVDDSGRWWGIGTNPAVYVGAADNSMVAFSMPTTTVPRALLATPVSMFALMTGDEVLGWPSNATAPIDATSFAVTSPVAISTAGNWVWVATRPGEIWRLPLTGGGQGGELVASAPGTVGALAMSTAAGVVALPDQIAVFTPPP